MLCARVMRGISSIENSVAPVAAMSWIGLRRAERIGEADDDLAGAQPARGSRGGPEQDVGELDVVRAVRIAAPCSHTHRR